MVLPSGPPSGSGRRHGGLSSRWTTGCLIDVEGQALTADGPRSSEPLYESFRIALSP